MTWGNWNGHNNREQLECKSMCFALEYKFLVARSAENPGNVLNKWFPTSRRLLFQDLHRHIPIFPIFCGIRFYIPVDIPQLGEAKLFFSNLYLSTGGTILWHIFALRDIWATWSMWVVREALFWKVVLSNWVSGDWGPDRRGPNCPNSFMFYLTFSRDK